VPKTLYLENTIVSYLTAKPSRDVHVRVHQETTRRWWRTKRKELQIFVSPLVVEEAAAGDQVAAQRRTRLLGGLPQVAITDSVSRVAQTLADHGAIPRVAEVDAVHVALAAVHGPDYLLTWNCKHIANATKRVEIEEVCREQGFEPPVICTPEELMEE
jgi:predicted nucleic acid-binding protein